MNRFVAMEKLMDEKYGMITDGKTIWDEIEKQVRENGLDGSADIEMRFHKDNKKILVFFQVEIERSYDEETDDGYTDINFVGIA